MTLAEILQKVGQLSQEERASLSRELKEMMSQHQVEEPPPVVHQQRDMSRTSSPDEGGVPTEDIVGEPKPEDHA